MPTVLKSLSGLSNSSVSLLIIIPMSIALIGLIINGNSSFKTGEVRWHIAIPVFMGAVGMGVWWTVPTTFLTGPAAAGATGLINSCGNLGGWVGPYLVGFI